MVVDKGPLDRGPFPSDKLKLKKRTEVSIFAWKINLKLCCDMRLFVFGAIFRWRLFFSLKRNHYINDFQKIFTKRYVYHLFEVYSTIVILLSQKSYSTGRSIQMVFLEMLRKDFMKTRAHWGLHCFVYIMNVILVLY